MSTLIASNKNETLIEKSSLSFLELIILSVLVLYWVNFYNIGTLLPFIFLPITVRYMIDNKLNGTQFILGFFCITYSIPLYSYHFESLAFIFMYLLFPISFYTIGFKMVTGDGEYRKTKRLLLLIIITFTLFGFLSLMKTLSLYGDILTASIALHGRGVSDLWTGKLIGATGLNMYLSFGLTLLFAIFLPDKSVRKRSKIIYFVCFVLSIFSVVTLGNRTGFLIIIMSVLSVFLFVGKIDRKKLVQIIMFAVFLLLFKGLYDLDFLGMKNTWETSLLRARFIDMNMTQDPRLPAWKAAFFGLFQNPMGGKQTILPCCVAYAHNMWLDVGYKSGITPLLLLVTLSLITLKSLLSFIKYKTPMMLKGLFVGVFTAFFITFSLEPVMENYLFYYFNTFCLILGIVQSLNVQYRKSFQK